MINNFFFKPTKIYREFMILDLIEKNANITQREISKIIGVAVSIVNEYLSNYEKLDLINRKKYSTKYIEYFVTKKGKERRKLLNIWYFKSSRRVYLSAKDNIVNFFNEITNKGFNKILLYGAGDVAKIILEALNDDIVPLEVLAVIDDDKSKQNKFILKKRIISRKQIKSFDHDGILVTSYKHHVAINNNLGLIDYTNNRIINFFDRLL